MKTRTLTKQQADAEPFRVWNAYVRLLAGERYEDLSPEQRPAHLVFWYESEVKNGGHLQFFENRGREHLTPTIEGVGGGGGICPTPVLPEAGGAWLNCPRSRLALAPEPFSRRAGGWFCLFDY